MPCRAWGRSWRINVPLLRQLDVLRAAQADMDLHRRLRRRDFPNGLLRTLVGGFIEHMSQATLAVYSLAEPAARLLEQHVEIVYVFAANDRELAARLIFQHQLDTAARFQ